MKNIISNSSDKALKAQLQTIRTVLNQLIRRMVINIESIKHFNGDDCDNINNKYINKNVNKNSINNNINNNTIKINNYTTEPNNNKANGGINKNYTNKSDNDNTLNKSHNNMSNIKTQKLSNNNKINDKNKIANNNELNRNNNNKKQSINEIRGTVCEDKYRKRDEKGEIYLFFQRHFKKGVDIYFEDKKVTDPEKFRYDITENGSEYNFKFVYNYIPQNISQFFKDDDYI